MFVLFAKVIAMTPHPLLGKASGMHVFPIGMQYDII